MKEEGGKSWGERGGRGGGGGGGNMRRKMPVNTKATWALAPRGSHFGDACLFPEWQEVGRPVVRPDCRLAGWSGGLTWLPWCCCWQVWCIQGSTSPDWSLSSKGFYSHQTYYAIVPWAVVARQRNPAELILSSVNLFFHFSHLPWWFLPRCCDLVLSCAHFWGSDDSQGSCCGSQGCYKGEDEQSTILLLVSSCAFQLQPAFCIAALLNSHI